MDRFRQFAENTTIHGVKDFFKIDYLWARCLWFIFFFSCLGMMAFEMYQLLKEYSDEPTATQVRQKYLAQYPYPRLIFCPKEWINETKVAELKVPKPLLIYALSLLKRIRLDPKDRVALAPQVDRLQEEFDQFLRNNSIMNYLDFYLAIADAPDMVSKCDQCNTHRNQVLASGVCIQWRAIDATSDLLIQLPPSFRYTHVRAPEDHEGLVPSYIGSFAADAMYVSFRPQFDFFGYDPILLSRNNSYVFRIKPTNYIRLDKPGSHCVPERQAKGDGYSQLMCYFRCDESYKAECQSCKYLSQDRNKVLTANGTNLTAQAATRIFENVDLPYCTSLLMDPALNVTCVGRDDAEFVRCARDCKPLCNEWVYETTVIPVAQRNLITDNAGADITCVLSYQVRFGETFIEEVPTYSWETFVSNIGGQLGLWMGASVVSLLQLLHFLAELCYYDVPKCARKPKKEDPQPSSGSVEESPVHKFASAVYAIPLSAQNWSFHSAFDQEGARQERKYSVDFRNEIYWNHRLDESTHY